VPPSDDPKLQARLNELFLDELAEQLERLEAGLESLATQPAEATPGTVAELFRSAHSLKGAAQAVSATAIGARCHDLEELLARVRDDKADLGTTTTEQLTRLVDEIRSLESVFRGGGPSSPPPGQPAAPAAGLRPVPTPAAGAPSATVSPPVEAAPTATVESPPARLAAHRVDALMAQAGDLITASYGSEALVERLARTGTRLLHEDAQRLRERETIMSTLAGHPAAGQVAALLDRAGDRARATARELDEILRLVSTHQKSLRSGAASFAEAARRARMVPFEQVTSGLPRLVRELAAELGKRADLEIIATDVEVDRELVILLREVLVHLVRNALDHGIEPPEERVRAGKDERGRVRIAASLRSDGIQVVVSDDGRGVDEAGVRAAADQAGLSGETRPDRSFAEGSRPPPRSATCPGAASVSTRCERRSSRPGARCGRTATAASAPRCRSCSP
jgi:two-component system chemotaxis sensor kinase CheA